MTFIFNRRRHHKPINPERQQLAEGGTGETGGLPVGGRNQKPTMNIKYCLTLDVNNGMRYYIQYDKIFSRQRD